MAAHVNWPVDTTWSAKCSTAFKHLEVEEESFADLRAGLLSSGTACKHREFAPCRAHISPWRALKSGVLARNLGFVMKNLETRLGSTPKGVGADFTEDNLMCSRG